MCRRQESIQFGDVLDMGVRGKQSSKGPVGFGTNRSFYQNGKTREVGL